MKVSSETLEVETNSNPVEIPIDFSSQKEKKKLRTFLQRINKFEIRP